MSNRSFLNATLGFFVLSAVSISANADSSTVKKVESQAMKFAESVSCEPYVKGVKKIDNEEDQMESFYVVWWDGDWGCIGGSGTTSNYLTLVQSNTRLGESFFYVGNFDILKEVNKNDLIINPRFIEKVNVRNGAIKVVSSRLSDSDSRNFPSRQYEYTIEKLPGTRELYGNTYTTEVWQITNTRYLGKND